MNIHSTLYRTSCLLLFYLLAIPSFVWSQDENCMATTLEDFFICYGGTAAFGTHSVEALTAFIEAEDAIVAGDYTEAKTLIDAVFAAHPKGDNQWWGVFNDVNGSNTGTPHAYYGLRMMEDIVDYHLNNSGTVEARKIIMKTVLVGCSEGIQPTTETELQNGTGPSVTNTIDPALMADDYRIIRQSLDLFSRYITAITKGELEVEVEIIELPELCMDVSVSTSRPHVASGNIGPVLEELSDEVRKGTDWWWVMYPSHVPDAPTFDDEAFITGGMGGDNKGGPVFIIDDKWIVRKPPHLGAGLYSDIERRIYLPQWLQHEFFHHLYRIYPELSLEVNGHDWFNINFWAEDFDGQFEADYYAETLHKRLQVDCTPLSEKLITRTDDRAQAQFGVLSIDELIGPYSLDNVANEWHIGEIIQQGSRFFWRNSANVQWEVMPMLANGVLETGSDSPYPDANFFVELYRTSNGTYTPGVTALKFQGDIYKKRFNLLRESIPIEVSLGSYTRSPEVSTAHAGSIVKAGGLFFWENEEGDRWALTPDVEAEAFSLGNDSPTPDDAFELIIIEDECDLRTLGFRYMNDYYWREKLDPLNGSPILINPLPDFELAEGFGTHSVDLSTVFSDPEGDVILLFSSSSEAGLISTTVNGQELVLSGAERGSVTIHVMGLDANGGLVTDDFVVQVGTVSNDDVGELRTISFSPNPTQDYITISGEVSEYDISVFSIHGSFLQRLPAPGEESRIDLSAEPNGVYLIKLVHKTKGWAKLERVIKY